MSALVALGGEDQALPAAEGEAGGDSAGGTGCALQRQRHQRFCQESRPGPQSRKQPGLRQPQPEAEGAGCQGDCRCHLNRFSRGFLFNQIQLSTPPVSLLVPFQCLRLLMHTFNREYSQVSSSASESKVSPGPGPLARPVNPSEPPARTAVPPVKYASPRLPPLSAIAFLPLFGHFSVPVCVFLSSSFHLLSQPFISCLENQSVDWGQL